MKRFLSLLLGISLGLNTVGCTHTMPDSKQAAVVQVSSFNREAAQAKSAPAFIELDPVYNIPENQIFKIKLGLELDDLSTDERVALLFKIDSDYFNVYTDRECSNSLNAQVDYDVKTNTVTIQPGENAIAYYREGIENPKAGTSWGGLQTYYLQIKLDTEAKTFTELKQPQRMMFTIATNLDSPTVSYRLNRESNMTLYWDEVVGATEYIVYKGSALEMNILGRTQGTEFVLTEASKKENCINTYVSNIDEYSVVAVSSKGVSKLGNIIKGEDMAPYAPYGFGDTFEEFYFREDFQSVLDLPKTIDLYMCSHDDTKKAYPVLWDLQHPLKDEEGYEYFGGTLLGTTIKAKYYPQGDMPSAEEMAAFDEYNASLQKSMATDVMDYINIPNAPLLKDRQGDQPWEGLIANKAKGRAVTPLEVVIAEAMLKHQEHIDLSAYPEAGDPAYLRDMTAKILVQYPLILDEEEIEFDFEQRALKIDYKYTADEARQKQKAIQAKVQQVVATVIKPGMDEQEKERALHDWLLSNATYQHEVLDDYMAGKEIAKIAEEHEDAFNPAGILLEGKGVCQSYAETYKLLCDAAGIPCLVVTGRLEGVPHAWNKVAINNNWYHIDATNNDGAEAIPYIVFNASDKSIANNYTVYDTYVLDREQMQYVCDQDNLDYYRLAGKYARNKTEFKHMVNKGIDDGKDFYIKLDPSIGAREAQKIFKQAIRTKKTKETKEIERIRYGSILNIFCVMYSPKP